MDRTTLTRNLDPLAKCGWVRIEEGEDRRTRLISLTPAGEQVLTQALPLWKQAQAHLLHGLGQVHAKALLTELANVVAVSR